MAVVAAAAGGNALCDIVSHRVFPVLSLVSSFYTDDFETKF